ncbi:uncharacterized protein LY89DRAFT_8345 [Mollisia scopiformis]|uniref:Uncharacterized protein n=1 Tax=Mollisia scopiformis TaxID=149040 RepID=A0A194XW84_MOLSC|nr:uncharacterized protein LY89DRAFT_8345 [Mollisia scopiformis]KUJ23982.1 hypothetical protein LY89DRAFT_8345 [Mollisia scopiformis]
MAPSHFTTNETPSCRRSSTKMLLSYLNNAGFSSPSLQTTPFRSPRAANGLQIPDPELVPSWCLMLLLPYLLCLNNRVPTEVRASLTNGEGQDATAVDNTTRKKALNGQKNAGIDRRELRSNLQEKRQQISYTILRTWLGRSFESIPYLEILLIRKLELRKSSNHGSNLQNSTRSFPIMDEYGMVLTRKYNDMR